MRPALEPRVDPRVQLPGRQRPIAADERDPNGIAADPAEGNGLGWSGEDPLDLAQPVGKHLGDVGEQLHRTPGRLGIMVEPGGERPRCSGIDAGAELVEAMARRLESLREGVVAHGVSVAREG